MCCVCHATLPFARCCHATRSLSRLPRWLLVNQLKSSSSRGIVPPMEPNRTATPPPLLCQHYGGPELSISGQHEPLSASSCRYRPVGITMVGKADSRGIRGRQEGHTERSQWMSWEGQRVSRPELTRIGSRTQHRCSLEVDCKERIWSSRP